MSKKILEEVEKYYTEKVNQHGASPLGVDWNSKESQYLRFEQLSKIIFDSDYSILDFGCGYGELAHYLKNNKPFKQYAGMDLSERMIEIAEKKWSIDNSITFSKSAPENKMDYLIASGLFNVKQGTSTNDEWLTYIFETLNEFNDLSKKGFSFNCLTTFSDKEYMQDYLFYADPTVLFNYCKQHFSKNVALLHDYNLYEFTILVRK